MFDHRVVLALSLPQAAQRRESLVIAHAPVKCIPCLAVAILHSAVKWNLWVFAVQYGSQDISNVPWSKFIFG